MDTHKVVLSFKLDISSSKYVHPPLKILSFTITRRSKIELSMWPWLTATSLSAATYSADNKLTVVYVPRQVRTDHDNSDTKWFTAWRSRKTYVWATLDSERKLVVHVDTRNLSCSLTEQRHKGVLAIPSKLIFGVFLCLWYRVPQGGITGDCEKTHSSRIVMEDWVLRDGTTFNCLWDMTTTRSTHHTLKEVRSWVRWPKS